jgi:hypothetical protein
LQDPQVAKSLLGGCRIRGVRQVVSLVLKSRHIGRQRSLVGYFFLIVLIFIRRKITHDYRYG